MENHHSYTHQEDLQPRSYSLFSLSEELSKLFVTVPLVGSLQLLVAERPWYSSGHAAFGSFFLLAGAIVSALLFGFVAASRFVRVVISSRGVTFYSWGYQIYTPWNNVLGIFNTNSFARHPMAPQLAAFVSLESVGTQYLRLRERAHIVYRIGEGVQHNEATMVVQWWYPAWMRASHGTSIPLPADLAREGWIHDDLRTFLRHYVPTYNEENA